MALGFGGGGGSSFATSGLLIIGIIFIIIFIIGAVIYKYWHHIQYKLGFGGWVIDLDIEETRSGQPILSSDIGRTIYDKDDGTRYLQFLNRDDELEKPERNKIYRQKNGRNKMYLKSPEPGIYTQQKRQTPDNKFDTDEYSIAQWGINRVNSEINAWQNEETSLLESTAVQWGMMIIFLIVVLAMTGWYQGKMAENVSQAVAAAQG